MELNFDSCDPQSWYRCKVGLPQLVMVNMIIDINGFTPGITSKLFDELTTQPLPPQMCGEPVTEAVWTEMVLQSVTGSIM